MHQLNPWLIISFSAAAIINCVVPVGLAVFVARRYRGRWRWWGLGLLVFLLFQVLTRIPAMLALQSLPAVRQALQQPAFFWAFVGMASLTAGLFEEGGRWLAFRFVVPAQERNWNTALMLGAGHGGLEVFGVCLLQVSALAGYLAISLLPPETFAGYAQQVEQARAQFASLRGWEPLCGAWERLGALAIQVGLTVMVLQAFRRFGWWWAALAAHTIVDFTAVAALKLLTPQLGTQSAMIATECLVTLYALAAIALIVRLRGREAGPAPPADSFEMPQHPDET